MGKWILVLGLVACGGGDGDVPAQATYEINCQTVRCPEADRFTEPTDEYDNKFYLCEWDCADFDVDGRAGHDVSVSYLFSKGDDGCFVLTYIDTDNGMCK